MGEWRGYSRLAVVSTVLAAGVLVLATRLMLLGAAAAHDPARMEPRQAIPAARGSIWDRHGALLACESYVYDVGAAPQEIRDRASAVAALARALGRPEAEIDADLGSEDSGWVALARGASADAAVALADVPGVYAESRPTRHYPLGGAAAHVLGFVNTENTGYYGVEGYYDRELSGRPGSLAGNLGTDPRHYEPPLPGRDLILSIDQDIQTAAAAALSAAVDSEDAAGGSIVVMEPSTGAILASTSLPTYDPNDYGNSDPAQWIDPVASTQYEPGSVMKAMTMAAALDCGAVSVDSTYEDTGWINVAGMSIANWDRVTHGTTTMTELLQHSLNLGAVFLSERLGPERFYSYVSQFGYGQLTGIDLLGEIAGLVHDPATERDWYEGFLATNSFGQGLAATPIQVASAMAAIANDGRYMAPRVVEAIVQPSGELEPVPPRAVRQVVAAATARATRRMLESVVSGRVTKAAVPGYSVGGKTGTSQIPVAGGYDPEETIASFVGFLPVGQPQVVIYVKIDRPDAPLGSDVAAPVFRNVAIAVVEALDMAPDAPTDLLGAAP